MSWLEGDTCSPLCKTAQQPNTKGKRWWLRYRYIVKEDIVDIMRSLFMCFLKSGVASYDWNSEEFKAKYGNNSSPFHGRPAAQLSNPCSKSANSVIICRFRVILERHSEDAVKE